MCQWEKKETFDGMSGFCKLMDNGVLNKFSSCNSSIVYCGGHVKKKENNSSYHVL